MTADSPLKLDERTEQEMSIQYQVIRLDTVVRDFVKCYSPPPAEYDWYIDPVKGVLILRLFVKGRP